MILLTPYPLSKISQFLPPHHRIPQPKFKFLTPPPPTSNTFLKFLMLPSWRGGGCMPSGLSLLQKLLPFGALIYSMKFFFSEVPFCVCKSTILPCMEYCHHVDACSIWMCWISCRSGFVRLMLLDILPVLNPWLFMEIVP